MHHLTTKKSPKPKSRRTPLIASITTENYRKTSYHFTSFHLQRTGEMIAFSSFNSLNALSISFRFSPDKLPGRANLRLF